MEKGPQISRNSLHRLEKRFGSSTRVDRARAALRDIRQGQSEDVRAFSTRFEGLLGKLPSWDQDWAKTQFIWGLHTRASLNWLPYPGPADLAQAIRKAEEVEMARNLGSKRPNTAREHKPVSVAEEDSRGAEAAFNAVQSSPVVLVEYRMHLKCRTQQ